MKKVAASPVNEVRDSQTYRSADGFWDEAITRSGLPRRHWRKLAVALSKMGIDELTRRWQVGQQLIQTHGVTYNVYGDPKGKERPWLMDAIPLVLDGGEWERIEAAVTQRVTLLNTMLGDLYGPQRLIRDRSLPAAMLYGTPNFLRPCVGIVPRDGVFIHSYAVDLGRSPDGQWWAIADRTQAPSGVGYALENRLVSARTMPSVFSQCRIRQLTRFFDQQREALLAMAPNGRNNPRVVLLTSGPHNETYFEHSFLARHWGFPLVEGADLTVRENRVYLKTLSGLQPVDLVLRRMDDTFCDPLELRGDSLLGVPGLVQAVRSGNVAVANALGSGLVETAMHMAFLPGLCRDLLGEELKMPSVATWWCGQEAPRRYVLDHLESVVIKHAVRRTGQNPEFPAKMDRAQREDLARRIQADPEEYVAQEQVALSTAPVRTDKALIPRHVVLRVYAAWDGHSWSVLPGGLTRVSTEGSSLVVSMQMGGGSKDTWVLGDAEELPAQPRPPQLHLDSPRGSGELPSRVGDNLFWLGRYMERVENSVRHVRALLPCLSGEEDFGRTASLQTASHLLAALGYVSDRFPTASLGEQRWRLHYLLSGMVYDPTRMSGIGWNLKEVRRVSWPLKERLSQDTWRVLQQLETEFSGTPPRDPEVRLVMQMELLDRVIVTLSAFAGLVMENTTRGYGWRFLDIGRRLERGLQTADLLRAAMVHAPFGAETYLDTVLQIADSAITYRTRYFSSLRTDHVMELLLADEGNPRSLGFQVVALMDHIHNLPSCDAGERPPYVELVEKAVRSLRAVRIEELDVRDEEGDAGALEDWMRGMKANLYDLSDGLTGRYFSHLTAAPLALSV
ncbi:MAG: circularly permuted type 2 ATP-grasp protein [Bryobacteraceae bacterium]|nr:circularly permuted type 2 ATP-grasp protein [Bryobacteraceae bacterium]